MNDLSLHLLDIARNSVRAKATEILIRFEEAPSQDCIGFLIRDNGCGMTPEQVQQATDPFFTTRTTRRFGMGLPLLRQSAEQAGGALELHSEPKKGTETRVRFRISHLDCPPIGRLANAVALIICGHPGCRIHFEYRYEDRIFRLDADELREALDGIPLEDPRVVRWTEELIQESTDALKTP